MSQRILKDTLSKKQLVDIRNECYIIGNASDYGPGEQVKVYTESKHNIYLPFFYSKRITGENPNKSHVYPRTNIDMKMDFKNAFQREVYQEAKESIRKNKCVVLSLHCGAGKCFAKNTGIRMYDGRVKLVQDIRPKDVLLGDDDTPRTVYSITRGQETMYAIQPKQDEPYIVNESHILTFKVPRHKTYEYIVSTDNEYTGIRLYYLDRNILKRKEYPIADTHLFFKHYRSLHDDNVVDIPLQTFVLLPRDIQDEYVSYKPPVEFECPGLPHTLEYSILPIRQEYIADLLEEYGVYTRDCIRLPKLWSKYTNAVIFYIIHSIGYNCIEKADVFEVYPTYDIFDRDIPTEIHPDNNTIDITCLGKDTYYGFTIDGNHRFRLDNYTVTHNTYEGIRLAQESRYKTAILTHRNVLTQQWYDSIKKFTTGSVEIVHGKTHVLSSHADYYIFNIAYLFKQWDAPTKTWKMKPLGLYRDIGTVIVDEAHVACASEMVKSLFYFEPRILIALTATPERKDGLDKILDVYFSDQKIIRISQSKFMVYIFKTLFRPLNVKNAMGKKDWSKVIRSISENPTRNQKIQHLVEFFSNETIMILCKLTQHVKTLYTNMNDAGLSVTKMCGNDTTYDKNTRILIGTFSKLGVGFDDTRFNCLILACDVEQVEQYAGRLRQGDRDRIIIDMVDEDANCKAHLRTRKQWYASRNGCIQPFEKRFPEFFRQSTNNTNDGINDNTNTNDGINNNTNTNDTNNANDTSTTYVRLARKRSTE